MARPYADVHPGPYADVHLLRHPDVHLLRHPDAYSRSGLGEPSYLLGSQ